MFKDFRIGHGAGCNDPDDIAFDESILISCELCVFGLLQNGDLMSGFDEFIEIGVERVVWDPCHRWRWGLLVFMTSCCQGDLKDACDEFCVFKKGFIEITDSAKENRVFVLFFYLFIEFHQRQV